MESPAARPSHDSLHSPLQHDLAPANYEPAQQLSTFNAHCSPSKTSRALDPQRLPLPKPIKAWDRVARPPADPDSRVKVVWERHALRRQTQRDANDRNGDYRIGRSRNAAEAKVVKRRKVDRVTGTEGDEQRPEYVATRCERRHSLDLHRKTPVQPSTSDGVSAPLDYEHEGSTNTNVFEQQAEPHMDAELDDSHNEGVAEPISLEKDRTSLQNIASEYTQCIDSGLRESSREISVFPEAIITDDIVEIPENTSNDSLPVVHDMEVVVLPPGPGTFERAKTAVTSLSDSESATVSLLSDTSINVFEPETAHVEAGGEDSKIPHQNDMQFFGETPEMQIETLRVLALPNTYSQASHSSLTFTKADPLSLDISLGFTPAPTSSTDATDDSHVDAAISAFSIADNLERPTSLESPPFDAPSTIIDRVNESPVKHFATKDEDDVELDEDGSEDISDSNDDLDCVVNPDELTKSLSATFATTLANAAATTPLDDDKAILSSFLARAAASKASRAARVTKRASLQNQVDSDIVRQALASPRQVLEDKDVNASPIRVPASPGDVTISQAEGFVDLKGSLDRLPMELTSDGFSHGSQDLGSPTSTNAGNDEILASNLNSPSLRRSSRRPARNLNAASTQSPKKIAVRRTDGNDPMVLAEMQEAKKLANLTRNNTRKNKGGAMGPLERLVELRTLLATGKDTASEVLREESLEHKLSIKGVRWNETLAMFQEAPVFESPRKGRAVRKAPTAKPKVASAADNSSGNGAVAEAVAQTDASQLLTQSQTQLQGETNKSTAVQSGVRRLRAPRPLRRAPGGAALAYSRLPDGAAASLKEAQQQALIPTVSNAPAATTSTPAQPRERRSRLPPPPFTAPKKSSFALTPNVASVTGAAPLPDGKENQGQALVPAAKSVPGASKLVSPKKVSLLPLPANSGGLTGAGDDQQQQQQSMIGALGTPARKRVGVRRK